MDVSSGSFRSGSFKGTLCSSLAPRAQCRFQAFQLQSGPTITVVLTSDDYATEHHHDESAPLVELVPAVASRAVVADGMTPLATAAVLPNEIRSKVHGI